ncbi:SapC family protein [Simiduia aestuariiviva]|uniref:Multidrug transporter n=1 Tax=Simiduia aestuariiviva TaxID=1510459 RepID=A0A839UN18_9GAMM|nr:hypothetical protein [Simiduia aestuariiviva]
MTKQLLIYGNATPISSERHRGWGIEPTGDLSFAKTVNSVPLTAVEFFSAAESFPVVFTKNGDNVLPLAVMGVKPEQNLFINEEGKFTANYLPAFFRRYPFVFSSNDEGKNFLLCIDETYAGCSPDGKGERLFDDEGKQTEYLGKVLDFLKEYQMNFARTQSFCARLQEWDLLEPMEAQFTPNDGGEKIRLGGFLAVSRDKLKALDSDKLAELMKNDGMELIFTHLQSLRKFRELIAKVPADTTAK